MSVAAYLHSQGYPEMPATPAAHLAMRHMLRRGISAGDIYEAARLALDPEMLTSRELYKYGHQRYPKQRLFKEWRDVESFGRQIPDNSKMRKGLERADWQELADALRRACVLNYDIEFNSGDPAADRNLHFWLIAAEPSHVMLQILKKFRFGMRDRDELLLLFGPLSDIVKKWPEMFADWCHNPKWLIDVKTVIGWMLTEDDALSKTGEIFSVAAELDKAQGIALPSLKVGPHYFEIMRAELFKLINTLQHKEDWLPFNDFLLDSDLWATDGIAGGVKVEDENGKKHRVAKRGVIMVLDPDEIRNVMTDSVRLFNSAFFKQDPAKGRVVFGSDWTFYVAWKWVEKVCGDPFRTAKFTSIGKDGLELLEFFAEINRGVDFSPNFPADVANFDFSVETELIRVYVEERLAAAERFCSNVTSSSDWAFVKEFILRLVSNMYIKFLHQKALDMSKLPNLVAQGIHKEGEFYVFKLRSMLASGLPFTASGGTSINVSWADLVAQAAKTLGISMTNIRGAGDDSNSNLETTLDAAIIVWIYSERGVTINPAKCYVSDRRTEFLRMEFGIDYIHGYPARVITSTFESRPGAIREMLLQERAASLINNLGILHCRGCSLGLVTTVWDYFCSWITKKYGISRDRINAPTAFGGFGLGRTVWKKFTPLPNFNYPAASNYKMNSQSSEYIINFEANKMPMAISREVRDYAQTELQQSWVGSIVDHERLSDASKRYVKNLQKLEEKGVDMPVLSDIPAAVNSVIREFSIACASLETALEYARACDRSLNFVGVLKMGRRKLIYDAMLRMERGSGALRRLELACEIVGIQFQRLPYINTAFLLDVMSGTVTTSTRLDAFINPKLAPIYGAVLNKAVDVLVPRLQHRDKYQCWYIVEQVSLALRVAMLNSPMQRYNSA
jgi:hypothetical protein